jgi:RNA-directed DNA polymerase
MKRGNARGAKEPWQYQAGCKPRRQSNVRRRENRLQGKPDRTEDAMDELTGEMPGKRVLSPKFSCLRQKLYQKAKQEPAFRFYTLYEVVCREDVLLGAWLAVRKNDGSPGVDGVSFKQMEDSPEGVAGFLGKLRASLLDRSYRPQSVKRVYIEKANGKLRPLGIPTIRDRVAQMAVVLVIEPIFEADFLDCSYGFRPERSAHDALLEVRQNIQQGRCEIYDADLQSYFDTIPHDKLMKCIERRISDGSVLGLIRMWLKAVIVEPPQGPKDPPKQHRSKQGTPQGGVISPLLANLYLHWFDRQFHRPEGPYWWANARMVRYADDFVIMARYIGPQIHRFVEKLLEGRFGLTINREKTKVVKLREDGASLNFLGYQFRYDRDLQGRDWRYLNLSPSPKSLQRERDNLREMTGPKQCFKPIVVLIGQINRQTRGWGQYFSLGYPRKAYRDINCYVQRRLIRHLKRRSQRPYRRRDASWPAQLQHLGLAAL